MTDFSMEKQKHIGFGWRAPIGKDFIPIKFTFYVDDRFFHGKVTNTEAGWTALYRLSFNCNNIYLLCGWWLFDV